MEQSALLDGAPGFVKKVVHMLALDAIETVIVEGDLFQLTGAYIAIEEAREQLALYMRAINDLYYESDAEHLDDDEARIDAALTQLEKKRDDLARLRDRLVDRARTRQLLRRPVTYFQFQLSLRRAGVWIHQFMSRVSGVR